MTIELSLLLSGISVAFAIFFGISNKKRNDKKDAEQETEERATANTLMMTKLENIADDVKDIIAARYIHAVFPHRPGEGDHFPLRGSLRRQGSQECRQLNI